MKNVEDIYPLSPLQSGMLLQTLGAPESGVGFQQLNCTIRGELDVALFERVWQRVVDRHPILRTAFLWSGLDEPLQVVRLKAKLPLELQDWRGLPEIDQSEQLEAYLRDDRARGFELSKAPLMRLALIRLADDTHQFVWSFHHLLLDGWCHSLILKEVFAFYDAFSQNKDLHLQKPRPYKDYIAWLQRQDVLKAEAFWRKTLKGLTAPTSIKSDDAFGLADDREEPYGNRQLLFSAQATALLQSFARRHQLTMNTLILGAWALLLSRYTGKQDVVVGTTVSGRSPDLLEAESIMGMFINNLPVRIEAPPDSPLVPWLKAIQQQQVEMGQYEYISPAQIQEWSEVPWSERLFEHLLIFENYPVDASVQEWRGGLEISNHGDFLKTNYPLTLVIDPSERLFLRALYDCRRFTDSLIAQMLDHYQVLLADMAANPGGNLSALSSSIAIPEEMRLASNCKADCRAMLSADGNGFSRREPAMPPRDSLELELVRIWEELFNARPIGITDSFFKLGGHSVLAVRMLSRLRKEFGQNIPLSILFEGATIEKLAAIIRRRSDSVAPSPIVRIQPSGSKRPFFCVHPGGGSALCYLELAHHLGPDQPFYGLQVPELDVEQKNQVTIEAMASEYIAALRTVQPEGPYQLGGYSFGGLVAFEMARQMQREGDEVIALALLDTWSPTETRKILQLEERIGIDDCFDLVVSMKQRARQSNKDVPLSLAELWRVNPDERIDYVVERAARAGLLLPNVELAEVRRYLQGVKARKRAAQIYDPGAYSGKITLLRTSALNYDTLYELAEAVDAELLKGLREAQDSVFYDSTYGWEALANEPVGIQFVPGNHHTMILEPHVRVLAERLRTSVFDKAE